MKKKIKYICLTVVAVILIAFLRIFVFLPSQDNPSGILLSFDDYYPENWSQNFDLFDKYGANVTFFINAYDPVDFCYDAIARGHEIGLHTGAHMNLLNATEGELVYEVIEPVTNFREDGIPVTSFAYPYGEYSEELNDYVLQYYKTARGGWYYERYPKESLKGGFVEARCMDNANFQSELQFRLSVNKMLYQTRWQEGTVLSLYSHGIEAGEWCISPERLEYIMKRAKQLGLEFYTFQELQQ